MSTCTFTFPYGERYQKAQQRNIPYVMPISQLTVLSTGKSS